MKIMRKMRTERRVKRHKKKFFSRISELPFLKVFTQKYSKLVKIKSKKKIILFANVVTFL